VEQVVLVVQLGEPFGGRQLVTEPQVAAERELPGRQFAGQGATREGPQDGLRVGRAAGAAGVIPPCSLPGTARPSGFHRIEAIETRRESFEENARSGRPFSPALGNPYSVEIGPSGIQPLTECR